MLLPSTRGQLRFYLGANTTQHSNPVSTKNIGVCPFICHFPDIPCGIFPIQGRVYFNVFITPPSRSGRASQDCDIGINLVSLPHSLAATWPASTSASALAAARAKVIRFRPAAPLAAPPLLPVATSTSQQQVQAKTAISPYKAATSAQATMSRSRPTMKSTCLPPKTPLSNTAPTRAVPAALASALAPAALVSP